MFIKLISIKSLFTNKWAEFNIRKSFFVLANPDVKNPKICKIVTKRTNHVTKRTTFSKNIANIENIDAKRKQLL